MQFANDINSSMKSLLKNPILEALREIKITKLLRQSNFVKRDIGYPPNEKATQSMIDWVKVI